MHFFTLVVLPPCYQGDISDAVSTLMAPYDENREVETRCEDGEFYSYNPQGWWDWYQIGGRWTGHLDGYNPETDPRNVEPCDICNGTGTRDWSSVNWDESRSGTTLEAWIATCNGCNGCHGTGTRTTWPTQWAEYPGDVARLGDVRARLEESPPYHIVGREILAHREIVNPDWDRASNDYSNYLLETSQVIDTLDDLSDDCTVVVVDCHS
jgi:hypothetical protein